MVVPPPLAQNLKRKFECMSLGLGALGLTLCLGCGIVPKATLDESRRVNQTLRADNSRLKDIALDLQSRNQDLSDRAVEDARRIAVQDEALDRLERSVIAYQTDRDKIEKSFQALERQVQHEAASSVGAVTQKGSPLPESAASPHSLEAFVKKHSEWSFDPGAQTLSAHPSALFVRASDQFKPEASEFFKELTAVLRSGATLDVRPSNPSSSVHPANYVQTDADASARFLATARGARIRQRIVSETGIVDGKVRLVEPVDGERRVSIRIVGEAERPSKFK